MKVRATQMGYDGLRRWRPGQEFEIDPSKFSSTWMVKLEDDSRKEPSEAHVSEPVSYAEPSRKVVHHVPEKKHKKSVI